MLAFVSLSVKIITEKPQKKNYYNWLVLAVLMPMIRYEGLFAVALVIGLLLLKRLWIIAAAGGLLAAAPVLIYALISTANNSYWLPNSIIIKGHAPQFNIIGLLKLFGFVALNHNDTASVILAPHLLILALAALLLYILRYKEHGGFWNKYQLNLLLFLGTTFFHLQLGGLGWFFRYEAYLVVLGLTVISMATFDYYGTRLHRNRFPIGQWPRYAAIIALVYLMSQPLTDRALRSLIQTPQASHNIYSQQYQMGSFLREFYPNANVVANDIGAINYLTNIHCLDLWGLGSIETARTYRGETGFYDTGFIETISRAKKIKLGIVFKNFTLGNNPLDMPASWVKVGEWTIHDNVVSGGDTVVFYAVDSTKAEQLRRNLIQFSTSLPQGVTYQIQ